MHENRKRTTAELSKALECAEQRAAQLFNDYARLYHLCEDILKSHKEHEDMEQLYNALDNELLERFPCPF